MRLPASTEMLRTATTALFFLVALATAQEPQTLFQAVDNTLGRCMPIADLELLALAANLTGKDRAVLPLVCLPIDGAFAAQKPLSQVFNRVPEGIDCKRTKRCVSSARASTTLGGNTAAQAASREHCHEEC